MTTFFTSDTHFSHKRIIELCNRPFKSVTHMNEMLIYAWNETVSPDDTVYHLGDVALGPWAEWNNILTRLNGYKILIVGNHDRIFKGEKERMRERFQPEYEKWFDEIYNMGNILIGNQFVNVSHFPYDGDSHGEDRYSEFRMTDLGFPLIHGHTHGKEHATLSKNGSPQFHVGVDAWNYAPVSEEVIIDWLRSL